jgi:putative endonuclease
MKPLGIHNYYVYILTNKSKRTLYTGVTNDLARRLFEHQNPLPFSRAFTTKYRCYYLIYYELFEDINAALIREKQIKGLSRAKKEDLIASFNPNWNFLNNTI